MIDLTGLRALVCGSSQGIGRACAQVLAQRGAELTLLARSEEALRDTVSGLARQKGQAHRWLVADFRDPTAVRDRVAAHLVETGALHILVNNTGGPPSGPIIEAKPDEFLTAMTMHVVCNQLLAQTVLPGMKQAGYGRIINILSTSVREPIPGLGVSNTTRWAVAAWAKTLSREVAAFGITVNNVLPGYTDTVRLQSLFEARARREHTTVDAVRTGVLQSLPTGRFARPEEIAAAVAFLASREAAYVNGVNLPVDGGRLASL